LTVISFAVVIAKTEGAVQLLIKSVTLCGNQSIFKSMTLAVFIFMSNSEKDIQDAGISSNLL
jgi:hypothetical protein